MPKNRNAPISSFLIWGYALAKREFWDQIVTEREVLILGNKEAIPEFSVEDNARMISSDFRLMSPEQLKEICYEVDETLRL